MSDTILMTKFKYFGETVVSVCDRRCNKAWGIACRPTRTPTKAERKEGYLFVYLKDDEIAEDAPIDPGTYEGRDGKPRSVPDKHNKWCVRECERSAIVSAERLFDGKTVCIGDALLGGVGE